MEDKKVVELKEEMSNTTEPEYDIEKIAKDNPELTKALEKLKENEEKIQPYVDEILKMLKEKIENPEDKFDLSLGFMMLSKCITYLATAVCKDYAQFQDEVKKAHQLVVTSVMPSIPPSDPDNFTMRRLILTASCLIDYLHWRELLGDYVTPNQEQANTPQE